MVRALNDSAGDRVRELAVVTGGLAGVAGGELSERLVESAALADVGPDRDRVAGPGVGSGQDISTAVANSVRRWAISSPRGITFMSRNWRTLKSLPSTDVNPAKMSVALPTAQS